MVRLALIGPRGSGKSTVGPLVAARLAAPFTDADAALEAAAGQPIARIFCEDGEAAFRALESETLAGLLLGQSFVLACGGGAVLLPANRERLMRSAFVVWLDASAATCWQRILRDPQPRPNLTPTGGLAEVEQLLAERRPHYESTAHARVDAEASPEVVADAILQAWHSRATA